MGSAGKFKLELDRLSPSKIKDLETYVDNIASGGYNVSDEYLDQGITIGGFSNKKKCKVNHVTLLSFGLYGNPSNCGFIPTQ